MLTIKGSFAIIIRDKCLSANLLLSMLGTRPYTIQEQFIFIKMGCAIRYRTLNLLILDALQPLRIARMRVIAFSSVVYRVCQETLSRQGNYPVQRDVLYNLVSWWDRSRDYTNPWSTSAELLSFVDKGAEANSLGS